jgi:two-component system NtrC family response regulator
MNDFDSSAKPQEPVFIARSVPMNNVVQLARRAAQSDLTVLIQGETGTGKELLARIIHRASPRCDGPFVPVHCGGYSDSLLASELFGHVRGAFTGAVSDRAGVFEAAENGTVFLDEIATMSQEMQVKLLRVLQERRVVRVGSSTETPVNARVLAATNTHLAERAREGDFREDLYYRIKVVLCEIPPLRERPEDIKALIDHFMHEFSSSNSKQNVRLGPATERILLGYQWPGNIRQLRSELERLVALSDDGTVIQEQALSDEIRSPGPTTPEAQANSHATYQELLDDWTRKLIVARMAGNDGNISKTAESLAISRSTLYALLKKYGLYR